MYTLNDEAIEGNQAQWVNGKNQSLAEWEKMVYTETIDMIWATV